MTLTRDQIIQAQDIHIEEVQVPEWGGSVHVKGMNGLERDRFEQTWLRAKSSDGDGANLSALIVCMCACDEDGKPLFTSADIPMIARKSAAGLERITSVASRLSGLGGGGDKDPK